MKNLPFCSCGVQLSDYRNKKCWGCHVKAHPNKLPLDVKQHRQKKYKSKWFQENKERIYDNYVKQLVVTPEKIKAQRFKYHIKSKFGIDIETYNQMILTHNHQCAICGYIQSENATGTKRLYVDHSHTTGKIRGLLCMNCNSAIGHFKENLTNLKKAVEYMEKWKNNEELSHNTADSEPPKA